MDLPDNNLLISAFRRDASHHGVAKRWLEETLNAGRPVRLFPMVEAGFLRVVTHPKIFSPPSPLSESLRFLEVICAPSCVEICPWTASARVRWRRLCRSLDLSGNDCNDAMLAATALERGLRVVTFDEGFKRFPGLSLLILD